MFEHKLFYVDMGALNWSVRKQEQELVNMLNEGWEIVYHFSEQLSSDRLYPTFILRRKKEAK